MKLLKAFAGAIAIFSSTACVSLLPEADPAKPRYTIAAPAFVRGDTTPVDWSLVIADPRTSRVYDTSRIAVSTSPGKVEYYGDAEWADRAPRLFQTALVQTFQDSGRILAVGDRGSLPIGDIVLQSDIRKVHLDVHSGSRQVEVTVFVRLTDGKGTVYFAQRFDASEPARSEQADDVNAAFNGAFARVITDIANWTFESQSARV